MSSPNSLHCTYVRSIHAAYMRTFAYITCWPLQALAEARTLAGGRLIIGPSKRLRKLERLWGAGTPLAMTKARTCAVVSAPAEDTSFKYTFTFTFSFTFAFTPTFTSTFIFTFIVTFTELMAPVIFITRNLFHARTLATSSPGIKGRGHSPQTTVIRLSIAHPRMDTTPKISRSSLTIDRHFTGAYGMDDGVDPSLLSAPTQPTPGGATTLGACWRSRRRSCRQDPGFNPPLVAKVAVAGRREGMKWPWFCLLLLAER